MNYLNKTNQYRVKNIVKYIKTYLVSSVIMFTTISFIMKFVNSMIGIIFSVVIGGIIYFIILLLFKDEMFFEEINKMKNKILEKVR